MATYSAEIKEVMNDTILKPSYSGREMSREQLIEFWGLREPDIEWFRVYEIDEKGNKKLML